MCSKNKLQAKDGLFLDRIENFSCSLAAKNRFQLYCKEILKRCSSLELKEKTSLLLKNDKIVHLVTTLHDHSPFLWHLILSDPNLFVSILTSTPETLHQESVKNQKNNLLLSSFSSSFLSDIKKSMRQERHRHALLVAMADIARIWDLNTITQALSDFADASVQRALHTVLLDAQHHSLYSPLNLDNLEFQCGCVFIALGKHGAQELNYSSDIDLVVFFDSASQRTTSKITSSAFYIKTAQKVASLLQERTADGFVHRVDYRLRPDPSSMPAAISLASAFTYYETIGQNWERAAFIKARPIAGDLGLGQKFLQELSPFVWRRYFDFASIADIHAMKRQIHAIRGYEDISVVGHDIKLGRGGIREIEFFVQTQQLIFGGRCPDLQGRKTLDMLSQLYEKNWITKKACDELTSAYHFLRMVEHRLQMVADEQTQRLPSDPTALKHVACFCGFASVNAFSKQLITHLCKVSHHYNLLFEDPEERSSPSIHLAFSKNETDPETLNSLKILGFRNTQVAFDIVRGWYLGRHSSLLNPRTREILTQTLPSLLISLGSSADPDAALSTLDKAFTRMPAVTELFTIMQAHERLRNLFADLLGSAPRLAHMVAQAPHVLDMIIDPAFSAPVLDFNLLEQTIRAMMGSPPYFETLLEQSRDIARQLNFLTGAHTLSGVLSAEDTGTVYSGIAQGIIRILLENTIQEFEKEYGTVSEGKMAVLGLGRLGACQMTAQSDLDLIILYDFSPTQRESNGLKKVDATVYYTRLTQRLIAALTVPTRRGRLYDVDLRLRPQGGKGPVAIQSDGFFSYQYNEADLWEHMALTRARAIAGDASFCHEIREGLVKLISQKRETSKVIRQAKDMRTSIASFKNDQDPWNMKLAKGGIIDLDFFAQTLVLTQSHNCPELIGCKTNEVFHVAAQNGFLNEYDAHVLMQAHHTFYTLQQWQRTVLQEEFEIQNVPKAILNRFASVFGLPDAKALLAYLLDQQKATLSIIQDCWKCLEKPTE